MKYLIHDWGLLMPGFVLWESLSTESKHALLAPGSNKPPAVHIDKIQPSAREIFVWVEMDFEQFFRDVFFFPKDVFRCFVKFRQLQELL